MKDSTNVRSKVAASGSSIFLFVVATIFAGAILFSTGTTATNVVATCAPVPANLVAWYRGENNANDFVGTNHGSLLNGATFAPGRVGQAFSFDGVDSMVNVPFTSALNVASAVTIEAWVKTNSTVTGDHKLLAGRPGNYQLAKLDDGRVAFAVVIGGNFINVFSTTTLAANTLTHVAGTYDAATGLVKIYVDGILTGTTVTAGIPDAGAQPFQIGGFGGTFVSNQFINNFGGAIDEVSLYNRALSASEIQSIFDANDAGKCVPCTPLPSNGVSWHRAENDANDSVGSNNGTLQNGAAFATGRVGQAFDLDDGTNAYVDIGNLAGLDNATGLTVMAWIKRQNAGNSDGAIVGKWRDRSTADNSFLLLLGGGGFAQNVGAFIIEFDNDTDGFLQDNTVIPFDTWTFVAATWRNSDGALKLYKNGIEKGSTTAGVGRTLRIHPAAFTAKIGEWGISPVSSTSPSFPGQIDEPAIFNRALTAAEILAIYDGDSAGMCLPVCTPPPSNLVSWYPGEGNANDQQGNNNGTLQNGATFAPGKVGQAFSFDGVNDSVDIANTTSLDFGAGNFSIEFWANLNSLSTDQMLFHKISGTGASFNDPSYFVEFDQPNALRFRIGEAFLSNSNDLIVPTSLTAGQWFHVAAVRNGDLTQIYLNGVLAGSQTSGSNINTGTGGNAAIGRCLTSDAGCARFVNGKIDEVSLYNRALSASEIQAIYDADSAGICLPTCTPPPSNLESWYRGEGDANDSQGTNHGTLVNGAGFATAVVNQGFNLDGVNDFVRVGNPPALRFGTGDFSIQAWVKTSFRGGTFNDYIISKSGVGNDAQFILSYNAGGTGLPSFLMSDGTTISSAIGTANLADGTFHHLAGVREGTTLRLYVDGVQVGTATTPSLVNATSANNVIIGGRDNPDFDPYFKGIIDEVQFLNRALSASEIQAIFNAGSAGTCSSTPLQISPTTQTVNIGGTVNFTATGGTPPYAFSLFSNNSLATIDPVSGVYTAGTLVSADTVRVTDALGATSDAIVNVSAAAPTRLAFIVQPMNATSGQSISPALQVAIQDNAGNTVTNATDPVTIALGTNTGGSTLSGNVTRDAVNGIATFDDLSLNRSGTGYELVASSGSLASATSIAFNVDPGTASQLVFTVQPSNAKRSAIITPAIQVEVRDANGNLVTNSATPVLLAIGNNPGGGTLQGSSVQQTINGVATFSDLRIVGGVGGHGYTLDATSTGSPQTTSNPFNIFGPTQLAFTVQPSNAKRSAIITPPIQVEVQDENGDVVTDSQHFIQLFPGNFPGFGSLQGVSGRQTINGVATFNDLRIVGGNGGHGYTLQAFVPIFPTVTSSP
ncbi:MAG: LamG domain-containing protein, partial [Pyrinomonadaceae bacterium]|nr:LamG domain-containing protein [Pyrinomonadaceae bacterium]